MVLITGFTQDSHGPDYIIQTHCGSDCRERIHMVLITEQGLTLSWLQKKDAHDPYHRTKAHMVPITGPELTLGAKYKVWMISCYWLWCKNLHVPEYCAWGPLWSTWTPESWLQKRVCKVLIKVRGLTWSWFQTRIHRVLITEQGVPWSWSENKDSDGPDYCARTHIGSLILGLQEFLVQIFVQGLAWYSCSARTCMILITV